MKIRVHIERLVLDGYSLSAADGRQVKAAVERELARLLATGGLNHELRAGGAMAALPAGSFNPAWGGSATRLGHGIARSVHGGIGKAK